MREREVYNRQTEREKTVVIVGTRILESFDWKVKFLADKKSILSLSFLVQQAAQVYSRGAEYPFISTVPIESCRWFNQTVWAEGQIVCSIFGGHWQEWKIVKVDFIFHKYLNKLARIAQFKKNISPNLVTHVFPLKPFTTFTTVEYFTHIPLTTKVTYVFHQEGHTEVNYYI